MNASGITDRGAFGTGNGNFALTDGTPLTLAGGLNAGAGTVTLVATGAAAISESTGTITAQALNGSTRSDEHTPDLHSHSNPVLRPLRASNTKLARTHR